MSKITNLPKGMEIVDQKDGRTRFRIQFDLTYKGHPGHVVEGESDTEPDMTLTLGQLLERHTRGGSVPMQRPLYFETEIPTFSDMTDIERYRDQLNRRLDETNKFLAAEKEEKEAEQQREAVAEREREALQATKGKVSATEADK